MGDPAEPLDIINAVATVGAAVGTIGATVTALWLASRANKRTARQENAIARSTRAAVIGIAARVKSNYDMAVQRANGIDKHVFQGCLIQLRQHLSDLAVFDNTMAVDALRLQFALEKLVDSKHPQPQDEVVESVNAAVAQLFAKLPGNSPTVRKLDQADADGSGGEDSSTPNH